jgi:hypothetical protein
MEVVNTTSTVDPVYMYDSLNRYILNPIVFIIVFLIIIAYFVIFHSLGNSSIDNNNSSSVWSKILGFIIVFVIICLVLVNALQYFFSINVTAYITDLFTSKPKIDIVVNQNNSNNSFGSSSSSSVPEIKYKNQIFNIPGNTYNYENAKAVCTAYGAKLATYSQIEDAYKEGGEWCNYGWSEGQMALFPTQKKTYDKLQTIPNHEHNCGRPGINGGFISNPQIKFGVNCYGHKPKMTNEEEQLMENTTPYPLTAQEIAFQKRVDYWRTKVDEILVSPFNYNNWGG